MTDKRPYKKLPLTYLEQIDRLRSRGMDIPDQESAVHYLQHTNYYRLSGYWLAFEEDHQAHRFRMGTTIEQVVNLYNFDRRLRLPCLDAIEMIEVSIRAQFAYQLGHAFGPHGYINPAYVKDEAKLKENLASLTEEIERSQEQFIRHLKSTYENPLPPIWAACEVMSLGLLSRWYSNLAPIQVRQQIAKVYFLDQNLLRSWLHYLTLIRNLCAHHSRFWNRTFLFRPKIPKSDDSLLKGAFVDNKGVYNTLIILMHLTTVVAVTSAWQDELRSLLEKNVIWLPEMQFPSDWTTRAVWNPRIEQKSMSDD